MNELTKTSQPVFTKTATEGSITFKHLKLDDFEVVQILAVQLKQAMNEHNTLYVRALLNDEQGKQYENQISQKKLVLRAQEQILFQGLVTDLRIAFKAGSYELEIHGISYSYLLDMTPNSRSFQDVKMTYEALMQTVMATYAGKIMDNSSNKATIDGLVLQYLETDWQFLKRLASHFNTGLICDSRFEQPMIHFGVAPTQALELTQFNYQVSKAVKLYQLLVKNGVQGLSEADFLRYEITTNQVANVGDRVKFLEQEFHVLNCLSQVEQGIFTTQLVLSPLKGFAKLYQQHHEAAGCSFAGRVIDVQNTEVRVHLEMDPDQPVDTACWFAYSTVYSSADGSGFYCMPELGDQVRLYVPDGQNHHAYVISSIHEPVATDEANQQLPDYDLAELADDEQTPQNAIAPGGLRNDPDVKSFRNATGQEIRLTPAGVYIIAEGSVITLTETNGIKIQSENDIEFHAEKNLLLAAQEDVKIIGMQGVTLDAKEASICLDEDVRISGQEIMSNGGADDE